MVYQPLNYGYHDYYAVMKLFISKLTSMIYDDGICDV